MYYRIHLLRCKVLFCKKGPENSQNHGLIGLSFFVSFASGGLLYSIRAMEKNDISELKQFTDSAIGENYYSEAELQDIYEKSIFNGTQCTLVLVNEKNHIFGVRITYPPTKWQKGKGKGLSPQLWKSSMNNTAYFQSLFIEPGLANQGWGSKMSLRAIDLLKKMQTKAIVCHSWKESPDDSSGHYLRSLGFELVATHPFYWKDVDYICTRCGKPCLCTAEEMIKYL